MDLIPFDYRVFQSLQDTFRIFDLSRKERSCFFFFEHSIHRKQTKSHFHSAGLGIMRIADHSSQHLITTADSKQDCPVFRQFSDFYIKFFISQPPQIPDGILRSGDYQ